MESMESVLFCVTLRLMYTVCRCPVCASCIPIELKHLPSVTYATHIKTANILGIVEHRLILENCTIIDNDSHTRSRLEINFSYF